MLERQFLSAECREQDDGTDGTYTSPNGTATSSRNTFFESSTRLMGSTPSTSSDDMVSMKPTIFANSGVSLSISSLDMSRCASWTVFSTTARVMPSAAGFPLHARQRAGALVLQALHAVLESRAEMLAPAANANMAQNRGALRALPSPRTTRKRIYTALQSTRAFTSPDEGEALHRCRPAGLAGLFFKPPSRHGTFE